MCLDRPSDATSMRYSMMRIATVQRPLLGLWIDSPEGGGRCTRRGGDPSTRSHRRQDPSTADVWPRRHLPAPTHDY